MYRGHSTREAESGVPEINVAKRQDRTAVVSAYELFSRLHVTREKLNNNVEWPSFFSPAQKQNQIKQVRDLDDFNKD